MRALLWFRNDLRLEDHRILSSIASEAEVLLCVFVDNPDTYRVTDLGFPKTGAHRRRFLLQTLAELDQQLRSLGQRLLVAEGQPAAVIRTLCQEHNITHVYCSREVTTEELQDEATVAEAISPLPLHRFWDRTLFHPADLPFHIDNLPDVFTSFRKAVEKRWSVRPMYPRPTVLPAPPAMDFPEVSSVALPQECGAFPFSGGPTSAMRHLHDYIHTRQLIRTYKDTRNGLIGAEYSSKFSPWLSVGSLSPRTIYYAVREHEATYGANDSTYWLIFELLWRDFFRFTAARHGAVLFHRWSLRGEGPVWRRDRDAFDHWRNGTTSDDFVDANMRELFATGWMSNRGRQNVASYLSKTLGIDWRWGAAWFESMLLDYDPCSNYGNWAYVAGVGNDPRSSYRVFNTQKQAQTYDADGAFRRLWL
ncbi:MAG: DASH family cryptochrome [Candidatus Kapaibacteriota bacterium]